MKRRPDKVNQLDIFPIIDRSATTCTQTGRVSVRSVMKLELRIGVTWSQSAFLLILYKKDEGFKGRNCGYFGSRVACKRQSTVPMKKVDY